jgi:hypothetical protein
MTKAKEGELIPNKGGRPSKYRESMVEELGELMEAGRSNIQICAAWDISEDTFYRWLKNNKDLKEAFDIALPKCQNYWETMGEAGMLGKIQRFNPTLYLAFMNNKFNGWAREKKEDTGTHINIESVQIVQGMQSLDDAELEARIQTSLKNFKQLEGTNEQEDGNDS